MDERIRPTFYFTKDRLVILLHYHDFSCTTATEHVYNLHPGIERCMRRVSTGRMLVLSVGAKPSTHGGVLVDGAFIEHHRR